MKWPMRWYLVLALSFVGLTGPVSAQGSGCTQRAVATAYAAAVEADADLLEWYEANYAQSDCPQEIISFAHSLVATYLGIDVPIVETAISASPTIETTTVYTATGYGSNLREGTSTEYSIGDTFTQDDVLIPVSSMTETDWLALGVTRDQVLTGDDNLYNLAYIMGEDEYSWYAVRTGEGTLLWLRQDAAGQVRPIIEREIEYPTNYLPLVEREGLAYYWQASVEDMPYPGIDWIKPNGELGQAVIMLMPNLEWAQYRPLTHSQYRALTEVLNGSEYYRYQYGFRQDRFTPEGIARAQEILVDRHADEIESLTRVANPSDPSANHILVEDSNSPNGRITTRAEWLALPESSRPTVLITENLPVSREQFWAISHSDLVVLEFNVDSDNNGFPITYPIPVGASIPIGVRNSDQYGVNPWRWNRLDAPRIYAVGDEEAGFRGVGFYRVALTYDPDENIEFVLLSFPRLTSLQEAYSSLEFGYTTNVLERALVEMIIRDSLVPSTTYRGSYTSYVQTWRRLENLVNDLFQSLFGYYARPSQVFRD